MILQHLLDYFHNKPSDTLKADIEHYESEIKRAQDRVDTMKAVLRIREKK